MDTGMNLVEILKPKINELDKRNRHFLHYFIHASAKFYDGNIQNLFRVSLRNKPNLISTGANIYAAVQKRTEELFK